MEALHNLLSQLNHAEIEILRNYLTCFDSREGEQKTLQLAEFLLKSEKVPSMDECSRKIYGVPRDAKIEKLKQRLKNKILDAFLLDINLDRKDVMDDIDHAVVRINKKSAQFHQLLYSKGDLPLTLQLLDEIITLAKEYENYYALVDKLKLKKWIRGFRQGEKEYEKINKDIIFYERCYQAMNKAAEYYYALIIKSEFNTNHELVTFKNFLNNSISELQYEYKITKSAIVLYYLGWLQVALHNLNKEYQKARVECIKLNTIITKNKSVYRASRMGAVNDNLARCEMYLNNYKAAAKYAEQAQEMFLKNSTNYLISKEMEFYALFYDNQLKEAERVARFLQDMEFNRNSFKYSLYSFFMANVQFKAGNFPEALKILGVNHEISRDKGGWEIFLRVLRIMCYVEMQEPDLALSQIENLKKHIERNGKKIEVRERDKIILKILLMFSRTGFDYKNIPARLLDQLQLLNSDNATYRWECLTAELIPFHRWVIGKMDPKQQKLV